MIRIKGAEKLQRQLKNLSDKGGKRANRKAVRAGTTVLGRAVKSEIPVDKGLLKKAETTKVSGKGFYVGGRAGADVGKLKEAHATDAYRPTNIDWLVEYGHVAPNGTFVPPSGAMRRAEANGMPSAEAAYIAKLATEIEREALKEG